MKRHQKGANGATASVIVFGVDDHDKPRAAVFQGKIADAARKAADQMKLRALAATTAEAQAIAAKLPAGRIQANGQGFVPYVRRDLYDRVVAIASGLPTPQAAAADEQAPGQQRPACCHRGARSAAHMGRHCGGPRRHRPRRVRGGRLVGGRRPRPNERRADDALA